MKLIFSSLAFILLVSNCVAQSSQPSNRNMAVIAYYSGNSTAIDSFNLRQLTHIIFSFCHLKGNRLNVDDAKDSVTIHKLVSLKKKYPQLKIMLSLGGWGGCEFCSQVFSSAEGRREFARSVKKLTTYFHSDGIDLDWEYPVIEGYPGHLFKPEDRPDFTAVIAGLRKELGNDKIISFAAGGFTSYLQQSVEWKRVMPLVNFVNIMSYDLVNGYSTKTGHHTPLYSNESQMESVDYTVNFLDSIGIPGNKMVIGAAFYARTWENVEDINHGLYQKGKFKSFIPFHRFKNVLLPDSGYVFYYDSLAHATHAYNRLKKIFASFDEAGSMKEKTEYVIRKRLKGIMFWELTLDDHANGLLDIIDKTKKSN